MRGISWYEAAAYAEFAGKELPTIHHWRIASGISFAGYLVSASNLGSDGPVAVATLPSVGPFGTFDTAGNVKEWCFNGAGPALKHALGGAWSDPDYLFGSRNGVGVFSRDELLGVRYVEPPAPSLVAEETPPAHFHVNTTPVDDDQFALLRDMYAYSREPLNPEVKDGRQTDIWQERIVTLDAAYGERFRMHLFSPRVSQQSDQVLVVFPGTGAYRTPGLRSTEYGFRAVEKLIESGRTVAWPEYAGMYGRHFSGMNTKGLAIRQGQDLSRCIDFLEESADYSLAKIGFIGFSLGANLGPVFLAVDHRLSLGVLVNGGLPNKSMFPERDAINFAPRVTVPVLMINGANDSMFPLETAQKPLLDALGTPLEFKKHYVTDGGHGVDPDEVGREVQAWLAQHFGAVEMKPVDAEALLVASLQRDAQISFARKQYPAAETKLRELLGKLKESKGEDDPGLWAASHDLARALESQNDPTKKEEARLLYELTYENQLRVLGPGHPADSN